MPPRAAPFSERLRKFIAIDPETGCHIWMGSLTAAGYGKFSVRHQTHRGAHVVAWELKYGPVPEGLELDHLCRNRRCANPAHLEPVTHRVNCLRGLGVSAKNIRKTHCPRGHDLVSKPSRPGARYCPICDAVSKRLSEQRRQARAIRKGRQRGEGNHRAKLTELQVLEIRTSPATPAQLAARYGVSKSLISAVRRREVWTHLGEGASP